VEVHDERDHHALSYFIIQHLIGAPPYHQSQRNSQDDFHHREKDGIRENGVDIGFAVIFIDVAEFAELTVLGGKCLYDEDAGKMLLHKSIERRHGVAHAVERFVHAFREPVSGEDQDGERRKADERQAPVFIEHHTKDGEDNKQIRHNGNDAFGKDIVGGFNVDDGAGG